jgi:pimeloyl-ACP methyl ester carboxylesterase
VILFAGFGDGHARWSQFQDRLSATTRVCSYDRLGEGTSSAPRGFQSIGSNVQLLHKVLDKIGVQGPLVLVGHSLGGDIAASFARVFAARTAGLVTFDATPVGYLQYVRKLIPASEGGLPGALRAEAVGTISGDNKEKFRITAADWAPAGSLGHRPVAVVEHGKNIFAAAGQYAEPLQDHWARGQMHTARMSSRSQVIIAPRSGHYIYLDQPQLALDVVNAVLADAT